MNRDPHILVIDDEEVICDSCSQALSSVGYTVDTARDGHAGLDLMQEKDYGIVILDLKMPGIEGMEVLKHIKVKIPETSVIVITGFATIESAVEAMKHGADDFLPKPFTPDILRIVVKKAAEKRKLLRENIFLKEQLIVKSEGDLVIGSDRAMREVYRLVEKAAPTDSTVLIYGESGTGKEVIARSIHNHSLRRDKSFVAVDCGSLAESLIESELFGHVKGSFTGAVATKYGRFEFANGGTIFLDDIGNVGLSIQAKLLRVIQEREVIKVGAVKQAPIDVRIITATNKDLQTEIKQGRFREDLFYRLNVLPIYLPPLRERKEDLPVLVHYFIGKYSRKHKKDIVSISDEALGMLRDYDWPGNIRELENVIERLVILTENRSIQPSNLLHWRYGVTRALDKESFGIMDLVELERTHIVKVLELTKGQKSKAARLMGIDRKTLYRKIKRHVIE